MKLATSSSHQQLACLPIWLFILPIFLIAGGGGGKTKHMFNFSLEGFTGVRIFITFAVTIYYSERIQIKISQKKLIGESPGEIRHDPQLSSPNELGRQLRVMSDM